MAEFYNFIRDEAGSDVLYIDGEISSEESWWGHAVYPRQFREGLSKCRDVTVWINSPGGDVFAAAEIYTALKEHKGKIVVKIAGIAASAASVIAMAGDEVLMSPVSYMMVHDPWSYARGNYRDMAHMAEILQEIGEGLIAAYTAKTGKGRDEICELLAAETYMSAERAIAEGFADGLMEADAGKPAKDSGGKGGTLMKANAYGPKAICALITPKDDAGEKALRYEIAQRARVIASIYQV